MWNIGDRVLALRPAGPGWYPGTIRHFDGERYYVIFDDKEDALLYEEDLKPFELEPGHQVFVRGASWEDFTSAVVVEVQEESLLLKHLDGKEKWTPLQRIRVEPERLTETVFPTVPEEWSLGDRVLACWFDLDWYPGVVLESRPDSIKVLFDMGEIAILSSQRVRPLTLLVGDRVEGRWKGERLFYSGEITRIEGEIVHIAYDDGDEETTTIRLLRLRRDEWFPDNKEVSLTSGNRVLACWFDLYWYPGCIVSVDGKRIHVAYDDGDQALVTPDQVKPLDIQVGDRVFCRWQGGPEYVPGEVVEQEGERILVQYDDGREEWTSVRMVRVERG